MKWGNWLIGACCALFVAVIVTPTGVYEGVWKLTNGKDAAAWVQAVGSIVAIFTSVFGAYWLQDRQRRLDAAAAGEAELEALLVVAISAHRALEMLQQRCRNNSWTLNSQGLATALLAGEMDSIRSIRVPALPSRWARTKLNSLRVAVVSSNALLTDLHGPIAGGLAPPTDMFDSMVAMALDARNTVSEMVPSKG